MNPRWKIYLLYTVVIIIGGSLLSILVETVRAKNTGFETKTLWDWMELLVIPLVLAGGAFYLQRSERAVERKAAENRAKLEREIATERYQETALQGYLDRMSDLLLKEKLRTTESQEARNVAAIRTLTLLRGLDVSRKGLVLRFLIEAGLISQKYIVDVAGADLQGADLQGANLRNANLQGANLQGANLKNAWLYEINLHHANLQNANLEYAKLENTTLIHANLQNSNMQGADLQNSILRDAHLQGANLQGANLDYANLKTAKLQGATLSYTDLAKAFINLDEMEFIESLKQSVQQDETKHDWP